jgi:hypothetical protein
MSFLPPGVPAGQALTLDSFALSSDPVILSARWSGIFRYEFPPDIRVDLRQSKVFSSTRIAGRIGTIKEVSGHDDWQVSIRFTFTSPAYSLNVPLMDSMLKKLQDLKEIWEARSVLAVTNERMNKLGIEYLFLKEIDLPDGESYWLQPVVIQALSDDGN